LKYWIDFLNRDGVKGWALAPSGIASVEIFINDVRIGETRACLPRPDVLHAHPEVPDEFAARCGFAFSFCDWHFDALTGRVKLRFFPEGAPYVETPEIEVPNIDLSAILNARLPLRERSYPAPFPDSVTAALEALRGGSHYDKPWTLDLTNEALQDLEFLLRRGTQQLPGIHSYFGYLKSLWAKFQFVSHHSYDFARAEGDPLRADATIEEVITIANHLYVLHENGVKGPFIRINSENGAGAALLSNACFELSVDLNIFDLNPPGVGEGATRAAVTRFGREEVVQIYPQAPSGNEGEVGPIPMAIWTNIDSAKSDVNLISLLERLPARSCIFLGCGAEGILASHDIVAMSPIREAFHHAGSNIEVHELIGRTMALWNRNVSWPVLPTAAVLHLLELD
jgi:hypothetical protein